MTEPGNGKRHRLLPSPVETKDKVGVVIQHSNTFFFRLSANRFKSVSSDGVELHGGVDSLASPNIMFVHTLQGSRGTVISRFSPKRKYTLTPPAPIFYVRNAIISKKLYKYLVFGL